MAKPGVQWTFKSRRPWLCWWPCLMSQKCEHMQPKKDRQAKKAAKTCPQVSIDKTEVIQSTSGGKYIKHSCRPKPKMKTATYLRSIVLATGWTDEDIKAKIGKGRQAFITLKSVWRLTALSAHNLLCIYNRKVKSILLCGSEMWSHQYQLQQTADLH